MAQSTTLGCPRIGPKRELKFALEAFWRGEISQADLIQTGKALRAESWGLQKDSGIGLMPSNDFSFYDHVLDMSVLFGVVPERYGWQGGEVSLETYFAMARGEQKEGRDVPAAEMTKWFDTNYHYIVPELSAKTRFQLVGSKPVDEYLEAKALGFETRPVLVGPVSYLLLAKCSDSTAPLDYLDACLECYVQLLLKLEAVGARCVQFDEPFLVTDLDAQSRAAYEKAYQFLREKTKLKLMLTSPYGRLEDNLALAVSLPVDILHVDLIQGEAQLDELLEVLPSSMVLAAGVVDGRNVWRNNLEHSLQILERVATKVGNHRLWVCGSCSFLHAPYDLKYETDLHPQVRKWLAFTAQKLEELHALAHGLNEGRGAIASKLVASTEAVESRKISPMVREAAVKERMLEQGLDTAGRASAYEARRELQKAALSLPLYPSTTIGSFPQTKEVRQKRALYRKGDLSQEEYGEFIKDQIKSCIEFQEQAGLDVLVHGEFERTDMVEFFGEKMKGFAFTKNGWVQSYGSRGVKPPIIYGDVVRLEPMTVELARFAQGLTDKPVKGMLTGPVTILRWSFVRDDQPYSVTAHQIALALQDEVLDLERAGIKIIQIDEPAFREGAPIRRGEWRKYFPWAVKAFRLVSTGVRDETQIHTHMCYSEFNDIISSIKDLDADVISIETSRSQMELLDAFVTFKYPAGIGPGVYDIHSPRVPHVEEMISLLKKASDLLGPDQIWVNPDCGLKTRGWPEVKESLTRMVEAARVLRDNP
ncbi:MAG: 5-methyltetrahydropteroyltriglutamate--homocysteine S-methyltransferase [Bdellovibrionales bacterium]